MGFVLCGSMSSLSKIRDPDEWHEEKYLICETELESGNKIVVLEDSHYDDDTDEVFWHGIQIQRISKNRKGKWQYREKLNIPYNKFSDFCEIILRVKNSLQNGTVLLT